MGGWRIKDRLEGGITSRQAYTDFMDASHEAAEREYHGGRYLPKKIISTPQQKYVDNWEKIWGKRRESR